MIDSKKLAELNLFEIAAEIGKDSSPYNFYGLTLPELAALLAELGNLRRKADRLRYMDSLEIQLTEAKRSIAQLKLATGTGNENRCETCRSWDLESKRFRLGTHADLPAGAPSIGPGEILHVVDQDTKLCRCMPDAVWKHKAEWCRQHVERIVLHPTTSETSKA